MTPADRRLPREPLRRWSPPRRLASGYFFGCCRGCNRPSRRPAGRRRELAARRLRSRRARSSARRARRRAARRGTSRCRGSRRSRAPLLGDRQETVRATRRQDRVDRDLHVAVGAVLEADGHREPRGELAVDLALGRARADRAPARRGRRRTAACVSRNSVPAGRPSSARSSEQLPRQPQALVDPVSCRRGPDR